jgi:hypothetical protein
MATQDLTVGGTAQPHNGHNPVSVIPFSYSAVDNPAASGDDLKLVALPEGALCLAVKINITTAEGTDTGDFGFAAAGVTIDEAVTLTAQTLTFLTPTYIPASGGLWLHADAAFSTLVLDGHMLVAYTNLDPQP